MSSPSIPSNALPTPPSHLRWAILSLLLLVLASMGSVITHDFTNWDDQQTISENPIFNRPPTTQFSHVDSPSRYSVDWTGVLHTWNPARPHMSLWVPVTYTVWALISQASRLDTPDPNAGYTLNPANFHLASLALHALNTLLLFAILRLILKSRLGEHRLWPAWAAAALFAVHPLQVESVAWTSGLKDLLWGFWALLATYAYLRSLLSNPSPTLPYRSPLWRSPWWWIGLACFLLGTLSKPTAMVIPALVLTLHKVAFSRPWKEVLLGTAPWFLFCPIVIWWTRSAQSGILVPTLPLPYRPLIALDALAFYLYKLFLPLQSAVDYGRNPPLAQQNGWLYWTWIFPTALAIFIFLKRKRWPLLAASGIWCVVAVAPVLGLSPFLFQYYSTVADHYVYVSLAGVALALAFALSQLPTTRRVTIPAFILLILLAAQSTRQMSIWTDSLTLFSHCLKVTPTSLAAHNNVAVALINTNEREKVLEAERLLKEATVIRYFHSPSHNNLAVAYILLGRPRDAAAEVRAAIETSARIPPALRGSMSSAYILYAEYLLRDKQPHEALAYLQRAQSEVSDEPDPNIRQNLQNRLDKTLSSVKAVLSTQPTTIPSTPPTSATQTPPPA